MKQNINAPNSINSIFLTPYLAPILSNSIFPYYVHFLRIFLKRIFLSPQNKIRKYGENVRHTEIRSFIKLTPGHFCCIRFCFIIL